MATKISESALDHSGNQVGSGASCVPDAGEVLGRSALIDSFCTITESIQGLRGENQKRIAMTAIDWTNTLLAKNSDYGSSVWEVPLLTPNLDPAQAILVRMSDKIKRIQSLMTKPPEVVGESLEDSIKDLGSYCLLYLAKPKPQ